MGFSEDLGEAVKKENKIRKEFGLPPRKDDFKHVDYRSKQKASFDDLRKDIMNNLENKE